MKLSPLQLEKRFFTKVSVVAAMGAAEKSKAKIKANVNCQQHCNDKRKWMITLDVSFLPEEEAVAVPYEIEMQIIGFFVVADDWPDDKVVSLASVNGPSVLYGAVREMVSNLTARGPHPRVDLPTMIFFDQGAVGVDAKGAKSTKRKRRQRQPKKK